MSTASVYCLFPAMVPFIIVSISSVLDPPDRMTALPFDLTGLAVPLSKTETLAGRNLQL